MHFPANEYHVTYIELPFAIADSFSVLTVSVKPVGSNCNAKVRNCPNFWSTAPGCVQLCDYAQQYAFILVSFQYLNIKVTVCDSV